MTENTNRDGLAMSAERKKQEEEFIKKTPKWVRIEAYFRRNWKWWTAGGSVAVLALVGLVLGYFYYWDSPIQKLERSRSEFAETKTEILQQIEKENNFVSETEERNDKIIAQISELNDKIQAHKEAVKKGTKEGLLTAREWDIIVTEIRLKFTNLHNNDIRIEQSKDLRKVAQLEILEYDFYMNEIDSMIAEYRKSDSKSEMQASINKFDEIRENLKVPTGDIIKHNTNTSVPQNEELFKKRAQELRIGSFVDYNQLDKPLPYVGPSPGTGSDLTPNNALAQKETLPNPVTSIGTQKKNQVP